MTYKEKQNVVNIFSALLITFIFAWMVWQRQLAGQLDLTEDFRQWGVVFLIFIAFVAFGMIAEIIDNGSQIYYYRKGV